jgi:hypothetical protein
MRRQCDGATCSYPGRPRGHRSARSQSRVSVCASVGHLHGDQAACGVGQAAGEAVLLEAMEATAHAAPESHRAGHRPGRSAPGVAEPERLLVPRPREARCRLCGRRSTTVGLRNRGCRTCVPSGSSSTTGRGPGSDRNRPVRSRTQGGVGPGS